MIEIAANNENGQTELVPIPSQSEETATGSSRMIHKVAYMIFFLFAVLVIYAAGFAAEPELLAAAAFSWLLFTFAFWRANK